MADGFEDLVLRRQNLAVDSQLLVVHVVGKSDVAGVIHGVDEVLSLLLPLVFRQC